MLGPVVLIILDGWGHRVEHKDNGIELAKKPFFDSLIQNYPNTLIDGSGPAVGLPVGIMGNSEVGHMNLGAGRVVYSGLAQIYQAIADGNFFKNNALLKAVNQAKEKKSTLHVMGLLSDGAVHSHQDHLFALLQLAKIHGVSRVAIHVFLDGRDTPPQSGLGYVQRLEKEIHDVGVGFIASVSGRYYAMDRDKRWDRVAKAFAAICGRGPKIQSVETYLQESYVKNVGDEFIVPASVVGANSMTTPITQDDAVIFFNFRADRAREISHAFVDEKLPDLDRGTQELPTVFTCLSLYDSTLAAPVAFVPTQPQETLAEILARNHFKQLHIAETEKYAHVTFFFNGGRETPFDGEDRVLIPSPREVATYDQKPEMSAYLVQEALLKKLKEEHYKFVVCNFANTDMVGHTAVPTAIFKAVETVDACLSAIVPQVLADDGVVIITADHGNAEEMCDANHEPFTAHTTNLVPFILVGKNFSAADKLRDGGRLCDVAPTVLELLGLEKPNEMTGESLIVPPHPDPLPLGEGEKSVPSPKGRGLG